MNRKYSENVNNSIPINGLCAVWHTPYFNQFLNSIILKSNLHKTLYRVGLSLLSLY